MNKNENSIYTKNLLIEFEKELNDQLIFSSFIRDIQVHIISPTLLYIVFSTKDAISYIQSNYKGILENINKKIFPNNTKIIYIEKSKFKNINLNNIDQLLDGKDIAKKSNINPSFTFDNYVVAEFNEDVVKAAKKIVSSSDVVYSPLFIYSSSGLGKTHLLYAVGMEYINKNKEVCYITPEEFTKKLVPILMDNNQEKINKIVDKYKNFDIIILDDIQMYAGKNSTLNVLFNLINHHINKNNQIIIASDREPELLGGFEDRFITRFQGGLTIEIKQPSFDDLTKVLRKKLINRNINPDKWEDEALKFIVRNHSNSIRNLEGAVNRIKFYEEEIGNIKYTQQIISKIFSSLKQQKENITKEKIVDIVAKYYGLTRTELQSKNRRKDIVLGRHISMWLIRDMLNVTYKEIGNFFNGRDHSTVISAIERIDIQMKINEIIKAALLKLKRKIEFIN